jgi:hypothetical protein
MVSQPVCLMTPLQSFSMKRGFVRFLRSGFPPPLEIRTQTHCLAGNRVVGLIYVAPRPDGFCIFKADGTYEGQDRRQHSVFRAGDIYVRRGTSSEPWRQEDVERIIRRLVDFEKESWRAERTRDLEHHISGAFAAASIAKSPIGTLSWDLDSETFARSSLEILRAADEIVVREFTSRAAATCLEALLRHDQSDTVGTIIDRLTLLVALGVYYDKPIGDALPLSANMPETVHLIPITEQGVYVGDHGHRIEIRWYIRDPGHAAQRRGRSQASTTKFHGSLQASGA